MGFQVNTESWRCADLMVYNCSASLPLGVLGFRGLGGSGFRVLGFRVQGLGGQGLHGDHSMLLNNHCRTTAHTPHRLPKHVKESMAFGRCFLSKES